MKCAVLENDKMILMQVKGYIPAGFICQVPDHVESIEYIDIIDGQISINESKKAIYDAAKIQKALDIKLRELRHARNELLIASDFSQLEDVPLSESKKLEWRQYRQALRDMMEGITDPDSAVFPSQPE